MTKETTDKTFSSEVLNAKIPVLVDFWAPWCGQCRQLSPIIDEIANDFAGKIEVYKCNVDDNPEIPSQFQVRGIPSLMIFKEKSRTKSLAVSSAILSASFLASSK